MPQGRHTGYLLQPTNTRPMAVQKPPLRDAQNVGVDFSAKFMEYVSV
jgi:hypothetical protein